MKLYIIHYNYTCKPIYTGIHLRRTICVSKEAMERLLSNPEGSLMACPQPYRSLMMPAQHFEPGDFTFRTRFGLINNKTHQKDINTKYSFLTETRVSWSGGNIRFI
ncbi:Hypothetical_protein [Hexamita inflata]|uniref:Hypothetical_protein n=1 Tax=Hexamita inflata TaxID=28002 RepID=A0AA86U833_9EUKA|nr:Hypothetical protein HINF_LOCUS20823 [Hexamita inflata]